MQSDDEIFADDLSGNEDISENDSDSDNSCDSGDSVVIVPKKKLKPIVSDADTTSNEDSDEDWCETDKEPNLEEFLGNPGLTENVIDSENVISVVQLIIGDDFFDLLVTETNRYHEQNKDKFKAKKTKQWSDVIMLEMKKFLGLIILMGQVSKDNKDEYWSTDPLISTPIFSNIMSKNRFKQIWSAWHFSNNDEMDENSGKLFKIMPVYNYLVPKFHSVYKPMQNLSLDEAMIPWRGRLRIKVYNAAKIIKYGVLLREVCESTTGYICNMEIYCGSGIKLHETIKKLMHPFNNLWHHLYMDNYYNSVATCEMLLQNKIRCCGTIRINRGLPMCLKTVKLKPDESVFRRKQDTLIQIWNSKRVVRMISNIHSAKHIETGKINWKTKEPIKKPIAVAEYNKYMKGVDRADQFLSYYSIFRKSKKWTKKVVLYLINCALFNAFCLYKKLNQNTKIQYKIFLRDVARHWLSDELSDEDQERLSAGPSKSSKSKHDPPTRLSLNIKQHRIIKIVSKGKNQSRMQCRVCAAHKKRSVTVFMCISCRVPLHRGACFESYHTKKHY